MKLLVSGGAGFIGSAFIRMVCGRGDPVVNLDKLTYAGNLENLESVAALPGYQFVHGDICDAPLVERLMVEHRPEAIVHFAAESHVDRSILGPETFLDTNLRGAFVLLEAARQHRVERFCHVSTDEVYGSLEAPLIATEDFPLAPSSPYSASKAGSDLLVRAWSKTYGLPAIVTRASNNYGPFQFPEKLIPVMVLNALDGKPLPVYGDGLQVRDWLHVDDHCRALLAVLERGTPGEIYNIGGSASLTNLEVVRLVLEATGAPDSLITHVADRPGHDRRYALSSARVMRETGWTPAIPFAEGLRQTVAWYRANPGWVERVRTQEYREYYARNYEGRGVEGKPAG